MDNNQNSNFGVINESSLTSNEPKKKHYVRMVFLTVIIILILAGGYLALNNESIKQQVQIATGLITPVPEQIMVQEEPLITPAVIQSRDLPWLELTSERSSYRVQDEVVLTLNGSALGADIVGYDILIGADPVAWEVVEIESLLPDFIIQTFDRGIYHSVTGTKDIKNRDELILDSTPIMRIVMRPKIAGDLTVSVFENQDPEQTRFVDKDVNIIEPQIGSITVSVSE